MARLPPSLTVIAGEQMKSVLLFASVAASWMLSLDAHAQVPSIREDGAFNTLNAEARTKDQPGMWKEVIENHGSSALVAFHATFDCGKGGNLFYDHDPLFFYGRDTPIPREGTFEIEASDPSKCPGGIDAAIFADGRTEGDSAQVEAISERRRGIDEAIGPALTLLGNLVAKTMTPSQVQAEFTNLQAAANQNHSMTGPERLALRSLFQRVQGTIRTTQGILITPSDKTAGRQATYDEIAATQNITLEQAQALVITQKLEKWRADLEVSLNPASSQ